MGGKSPNIIFPDADLDCAIETAVVAFCRNSGQICSAGTRLFVHESLHDEIARRVSEIAATCRVGSLAGTGDPIGPHHFRAADASGAVLCGRWTRRWWSSSAGWLAGR
ncbi:aldehyde dehydrogenase family protein [Cupriavidus basilensis]